MIAGATLTYWIGFHVLVAVLLLVDLALLHRGSQATRLRAAWGWTIFLASLAGGFAIFLSKTQGHQPGLEFFSGYLIEASLSVDNLFVFAATTDLVSDALFDLMFEAVCDDAEVRKSAGIREGESGV